MRAMTPATKRAAMILTAGIHGCTTAAGQTTMKNKEECNK